MKVVSSAKTDIGRKRDHNEDNIWVSDELGLYIVADGVGGYKAGEVASKMATKMISEAIAIHLENQQTSTDIQQFLVTTLESTNDEIYAMAQKSSQHNEMSTTVVLALFQLPMIYICHAGDSRAYLLNDKQITCLTEDDVWVTSGKLRNVLTKAIGQEHSLEPTFSEVSVSTGDWLLLCSDGLWDMLKDEQIQAIFQQSETPADFANLLVSAANDAGGLDNISVVVVKVVNETEVSDGTKQT